uniref:Uncharacterized protein n=1 Tax=Siphoviridae sp. ct3r22 TaxID=2825325 RepID=A0A8S5V153_9CAUD|nr:MAG TPA: hypothetical protein [Siphoviridae sp. ct3r22]
MNAVKIDEILQSTTYKKKNLSNALLRLISLLKNQKKKI